MKRIAMAVIAALALLVSLTGAAYAAANENASCAGAISSVVGPPPGDAIGQRSDHAHAIKAIAGELGVPPGAIVASVAQTHEGSYEACVPDL